MSSRDIRRQCPEKIRDRITKAQGASFYIVQELGPTAFVLKEVQERHESRNSSGMDMELSSFVSDRKFKVALGTLQSCTCSRHILENDLCIHILWVMLKIFHVSPESEMIYQKSLIEREIQELIQSRNLFRPRMDRSRPANNTLTGSTDNPHPDSSSGPLSSNERAVLEPRPIEATDVCPICQEELLHEKGWATTHCRYSCGNSIHVKCMKVLLDYQVKSMGVDVLKCPLCRSDFGSVVELNQIISGNSSPSKDKSTPSYSHIGTSCHGCSCSPITGILHKCRSCPILYLCDVCFKKGAHSEHAFDYKTTRSSRPKPSSRVLPMTLPQGMIHSLQNRELTDADYETLLMLDRPSVQGSLPLHIINSFPLVKIRTPKDRDRVRLCDGQSDTEDGTCKICEVRVSYGEIVRQLPCRHGFHQACADRWLLHTRTTCPVCGMAAYSMASDNSPQEETDPQTQSRIPRLTEAVYKAAVFQNNPYERPKRRIGSKSATATKAEEVDGESSRFLDMGLQVLSIGARSSTHTRAIPKMDSRLTRHLPILSSSSKDRHFPSETSGSSFVPTFLQVHSFGSTAISAEEVGRGNQTTRESSSGRSKVPTTIGRKTFGLPSNQATQPRRPTVEIPSFELEARGIRTKSSDAT